MATTQKPVVFISHISEEKQVAVALQELVETAFLQALELFVASDDKSIPMGKEWLNAIKDRLINCIFEIVIASPESIGRVWIGFEAGAVWIRDRPVIALCHSGITKDTLPPPLGHLQGANAGDEADLRRIFSELAAELGMACPQVDFTGFLSTIKTFEEDSFKSQSLKSHALLPAIDGLSGIEICTLKSLAGFPESLNCRAIPLTYLIRAVEAAGFHASAALTALTILERVKFVNSGFGFDSAAKDVAQDMFGNTLGVRMMKLGWEWLERNRDKLDFRRSID